METNQEYVLFKLDNETYGIKIDFVENIEKLKVITRVPFGDEHIEGVINLRGNIIPVVNLRNKLKLELIPYTEDTRIVIINYKESKLGLLVDSSSEVIELLSTSIEKAPIMKGNNKNDFITQVGKKDENILLLLDIEKVLA